MISYYYRKGRRCWRKFYRAHREGLDNLAMFLGAFFVFGFVFVVRILAFLLGGM